MPISDTVLDVSLSYIDDNCENLYLCNADPGLNFTQASSTYKIGTKATPTISTPTDGDTSGRKIIVSAITDGVVDSSDTATHVALTDDSASLVLCSEELSSSKAIVTGSPFTLTEFDITIPDPA